MADIGLRCGALTLAALLAAPAAAQPDSGTDLAPQERQCIARGWSRLTLDAAGNPRRLLWKAPAGRWSAGAIVVLHGGGGAHFHYCVANAPMLAPQVAFTARAIARGFAVFALDSSDRVTDHEGRSCGKVWDDELRERPNIDLPFIAEVISGLIPRLRPAGSRAEVFLAGLSSGGYMALRAATSLGDRIAAFAPVSSGDPYGWHRVCERGMTARTTVHGVGLDNETRRRVDEPGACAAPAHPAARAWDAPRDGVKPPFMQFRHADDGVHDLSCSDKAGAALRARGYPDAGALTLRGDGRRSFANHLWLDAYNEPMLDFFAARVSETSPPSALPSR